MPATKTTGLLFKAISDLKPPHTRPPRTLLATDWCGWLTATHESIWELHCDPLSHNHIAREGWYSEVRALSGREWHEIQKLIRTHGLICEMRNACFGFGCGMTVYADGDPIYPGIPIEPKFLINLTQRHLPGGKARFEDAWPEFVRYTHTADNTVLLARNGLPAPREKSHYEY